MESFRVLLLLQFLGLVYLVIGQNITTGGKNLVHKDLLTETKRAKINGNLEASSPLKDTINSLLKGMELSSVKRSVDDLLLKESVDLSKFTKPKKTKQLPSLLQGNEKNNIRESDWLKEGVKAPDWLKTELLKEELLKKEIVIPDWFQEELDKEEEPPMPEFLKKSLLNTANEIGNKRTANDNVLKELLGKETYDTFDNSEKKTVDRFIAAMKDVSDEETKMELEKQLKKQSTIPLSPIDGKINCKDKEPDCVNFKYYCNSRKKQMMEHCAKTCGLCTSGCDPDIATSEQCQMIKDLGLCERPTSQLLCTTTCLCKSCENSVYGCCWDKKTLKNDRKGTNCPLCKDKYDVSVCSIFKNDCESSNNMSKKWMQENCMSTCGLCPNDNEMSSDKLQPSQFDCQDQEMQSEFCLIWKSAGWCDLKKEVMEKFCMKTCYHCNMVSL